MISLAVKYRPTTFNDVVSQDSIKAILQQQIESQNHKNCYLFTGGAGTGKAQPLNSKVLTPKGFVNMGDIKVGNKVFTDSGKVTKVIGVYPQGERDIYEIVLQDRTKIRVSDEHLNKVYQYFSKQKQVVYSVLTTKQLIEEFNKKQTYKFRVETPVVNWKKHECLIDPYLLGILIAEGGLCHRLCFSNSEPDIIEKVNHILKRDYGMVLKNIRGGDYSIVYIENPGHNGSGNNKRNYDVMKTLKGQLDHYGMRTKSIYKHIPKEYLFNDYETRVQLLQGMIDGDGYIGKRGDVTYSTSSARLSEDFAFLVRSLGIRDTVSSAVGRIGEKEYSTSYSHYLHIPNDLPYCTSKKHLARHKPKQNGQIRTIVAINYVGKEECQCIMVEHEDHTYISDDFIPTHNTTCARIFAKELNGHKGNAIEIDAASNNGVENVRGIIEDSKHKSLDSEFKIYILDEVHMLSTGAWNAMLKLLEEPPLKTIFLMCTTDPQKIPPTILSRVQRFDFHRIPTGEIVKRLKYILEEESDEQEIDWDLAALEYVAKIADGGMRDAITLLDKCLSYNPTQVTMQTVITSLGVMDYSEMFNLFRDVYHMEDAKIIRSIEDTYMNGKDLKQFTRQFFFFVLELIKYNIVKDFKYTSIPNTYVNECTLTPGEQEFATKLVIKLQKLVNDIKWEQNPKPFIIARLLTI